MTCNLARKCKNTAEFNVIHKAVGAMPERHVNACAKCAGRVGGGITENRFYKVVKL